MQQQQLPKEYYTLLFELQAVDFALVELSLYLNTHPHDINAIRQFNEFGKQRRHLKKEFESKFHPLQQFGNSYVAYPFSWSESPWPWQI